MLREPRLDAGTGALVGFRQLLDRDAASAQAHLAVEEPAGG
jgi:hypothetical protein